MLLIKKKDLVFILLFFTAIIVTCFLILSSEEQRDIEISVLISFLINFILSLFNLILSVKKRSYSFAFMFWLFSLFFFCVAPTLQSFSDIYAWNLQPTNAEILKTNIFISIWLISYILGAIVGKKYKIKSHLRSSNSIKNFQYRIDHKALNIMLIISGLIVIYYLTMVGFENLFMRSTNSNDQIETKAISLLTNHGFHNILLFTTVIHILDAKRTHIKFSTIVSILFFLIGCFPTGISRNMMASFYCGLLIVSIDSARNKKWITWAIFCGLILVFPAMSIFRNLNAFRSSSIGDSILYFIQNTYLTGDYDAHQMFISIQRWVAKDGLTVGKQLLGALLFFVPRSIWPSKALGTGQSAFEATNQYWFTNVSAPLPSEGYVNFGIPGIFLFGLAIGYITAKIDVKYWNSKDSLSMIRVIYPFSMLMFFFMNRGDLMSTWSYTFAQLVIGILVYKFVIKVRKL